VDSRRLCILPGMRNLYLQILAVAVALGVAAGCGGCGGGGTGGDGGAGGTIDQEACDACGAELSDDIGLCGAGLDACAAVATEDGDFGICYREYGLCGAEASNDASDCYEKCGDLGAATNAACGAICSIDYGECLGVASDDLDACAALCEDQACLDGCFVIFDVDGAMCDDELTDCADNCPS
jgi:hypothetical protein